MLTLKEQFIAILSNDIIAPSDAIILLEGDGFNRIKKAADLYHNGYAPKIVFSGGALNYDYGSFPASDILPHLHRLGIPEKDIIVESRSKHTQAQAIEFLKLAQENSWHRAILVASPDHQYRAYLTFLKQILNLKFDFILFNSPANNLPWYKSSTWGAPIDRIEQEFIKIEEYKTKGHIASFEDALQYQQWKELQLMMQK